MVSGSYDVATKDKGAFGYMLGIFPLCALKYVKLLNAWGTLLGVVVLARDFPGVGRGGGALPTYTANQAPSARGTRLRGTAHRAHSSTQCGVVRRRSAQALSLAPA